jgi:peptide/nickel transport system ATP-binding protein
MGRREARAATVELFRDVGISMPEARVDAYSWQLSGGLRQRAMIAMALSCQPRLLIADEPTTAIDVTTQAQVLNLLRELRDRRGTAIVFITHDLGVIAQIAHQVVVMYLGRVMEQGPVDTIFHEPTHPYTRALLRSIPGLRARPRVALPTITGSIPHPLNRPSGCPFHPRCPDVLPGVCAAQIPRLRPVGARQAASCFLYHREAEAP